MLYGTLLPFPVCESMPVTIITSPYARTFNSSYFSDSTMLVGSRQRATSCALFSKWPSEVALVRSSAKLSSNQRLSFLRSAWMRSCSKPVTRSTSIASKALALSSEITADVATDGDVDLDVLEELFVEVVCEVRAAFDVVTFLPVRAGVLYGR